MAGQDLLHSLFFILIDLSVYIPFCDLHYEDEGLGCIPSEYFNWARWSGILVVVFPDAVFPLMSLSIRVLDHCMMTSRNIDMWKETV